MNGCTRAVWIGIVLGACTVGTAVAAPPMAQQKPIPIAPPAPSAVAVKLEAAALKIAPAAPKTNQPITLTLTIKNTGTAKVSSIPWKIHRYTDNTTLGSGTVASLEAGAQTEVSATFTQTSAGTTKYQGYVDPSGTLKNTAPASAQTTSMDVSVVLQSPSASGGAPAPVQLEEKWLDYNSAKGAGARFAHNEGTTKGCDFIGQFPPYNIANAGDAAVFFRLSCAGLGGKADPEAFADFRLKNGWRVKEVKYVESVGSGTSWQWTTRPQEGSDNPYTKVHLVVNPNPTLPILTLAVRIRIAGPAGTDPYVAAAR